MKILIIMDPGILIPVKGYGGIERIIEMLALEHVKNGHEVHLLLTSGSTLEGCIVHEYGKEGFPPKKWDALKAIPTVWKFLQKHGEEFDLVHNFGRLVYLLPIINRPVKKIMSYQREITRRNILWINAMPHKILVFTGCSQNLINRARVGGNWEAVYNACDFSKYNLKATVHDDAPLIFLSRIEKIKGCHTAINVARATGHKLIIAGNISTLPEEREYYEKEIAPQIDGEQIQYVGTLNDVEKNEWLGKARAMLFPIEWNEPFGIVMVEAMACGTPVIAFNKGSVNEVIDEGITGFKVAGEEDMIAAVNKLDQLSRAACREQALKRFDIAVMAKRFLHVIRDQQKSIVIITTHQPAANPRAMKEYETLKEEGYRVKFLYAYNADWSYHIDEEKFKIGLLARQDFIEVGGNPHSRPISYFLSRLVFKLIKEMAGLSSFCRDMATARTAVSLWATLIKYPAQLYSAHYLGALPASLRANRKFKANLVFDAEDFHRGEESYYASQVENTKLVEDKFLPLVDFITTASPLITAEYLQSYPQQKIFTINNVFSKRFLQAIRPPVPALRLFWFSQNIGSDRGLEIFVKALNLLPGMDITLTIMGNLRLVNYREQLLNLSDNPARIFFKEPVAPDEIFNMAADYDIGLAGEMPNCRNKEICLSNKIFTYLLAGNCILASDMDGQREFMNRYTSLGYVYKHNDEKDLAEKIATLYNNRSLLQHLKMQSLKIAADELNWEKEKTKWLPLINLLLYGEDSQSFKIKIGSNNLYESN